MSKKQSNPMPPKNAIKPPAPPSPPSLNNKVHSWQRHDDPPSAESGKWSREVVVITNYGDVFMLCYSGTKTEGSWQRPARFNPGEKVEWWIDKPEK